MDEQPLSKAPLVILVAAIAVAALMAEVHALNGSSPAEAPRTEPPVSYVPATPKPSDMLSAFDRGLLFSDLQELAYAAGRLDGTASECARLGQMYGGKDHSYSDRSVKESQQERASWDRTDIAIKARKYLGNDSAELIDRAWERGENTIRGGFTYEEFVSYCGRIAPAGDNATWQIFRTSMAHIYKTLEKAG